MYFKILYSKPFPADDYNNSMKYEQNKEHTEQIPKSDQQINY